MTTRRYISGIQSSWFANGCGRVSQSVEEESFSIVNDIYEFSSNNNCEETVGKWMILDLGE